MLNDSNDISAEDVSLLQLPEFRKQIAAALITYNDKRTVGRPSGATESTASSSTVGKRAVHPVADVRYDKYDHFPVWVGRDKKSPCKFCKKSDTQCKCSKCGIHLCCKLEKNCFYDYHQIQL